MKIFDCFTYFNEEDILRIRLEELDDVVDYFVIVEASQTFTGIDKPFYLDNVPSWIQKWEKKIITVRIDFPSSLTTSWEREYFQRNAIVDGLSLAKKNDIILISDADEIIKPSVIQKLKKIKLPTRLDNNQYFWNFHWMAPQHCNQGARPVALKFQHLANTTPQDLRSNTKNIIPDAGWHFSYFASEQDIVKKIESFAHTEYNKDEFKSIQSILNRIEEGIDPFDRFPLKYYEIDETYPVYVQNNYK